MRILAPMDQGKIRNKKQKKQLRGDFRQFSNKNVHI
jgi:hypothetical protein